MKEDQRKLLTKLAYLYYIEGKSQAQIAEELGIYRTTISRMLTKARTKGIVKIEIEDFDSELFQLETYVRRKYGLKGLELVENHQNENESDLFQAIAKAAATLLKGMLVDDATIGFSWGTTLSKVVDKIRPSRIKNLTFCPLTGGPSYINARYHVNTLIYEMSRKFQGTCSFTNAMVVQENLQLAQGIKASKYYRELKEKWKKLDVAIVGVGGVVDEYNKQWLDMLTQEDCEELALENAVGETCCRFIDVKGNLVYSDLQERTIGISLDELACVPKTIAVAYGKHKAAAILALLRKKYINHLVTDVQTILTILHLDEDETYRKKAE